MLRHNLVNFRKLILLVALMLTSNVLASEIRGYLVDSETGNPISNATIAVKVALDGQTLFSTSDMKGSFIFPKVGTLPFEIEISHLNYDKMDVKLNDFSELHFYLKRKTVHLQDVVVSTGRQSFTKPVGTVSDINRQTIDMKYSTQEVPQLVSELPNVYAFNWSGAEVGASNLRIRGFDNERISATVNGIPLNDPEDHNIYWQDMPDLMASTYDIQLERGVSNFLAGPPGIGGSINLVSSNAVANRELGVSTQFGSYNTFKRTALFRSGLIESKYHFTSRFSKINTDGYRDHTSADMWSYFLAVARYDEKHVLKAEIYGGQMEMDAYWWGINKDLLSRNRKANPSAWYKLEEYNDWDSNIEYYDERDFFQQPHYMLHSQWQVTPNIEINQSFFNILGFGFYDDYRKNRQFSEYNLTPFERLTYDSNGDTTTVTVNRTDLIRRKSVEKNHFGWLPRMSLKLSEATSIDLGLEARFYRSNHWGQVMWAKELDIKATPQHKWYQWFGDKDYYSAYFSYQSALSSKLKYNAGLQFRSIEYRVKQEVIGAFSNGYDYTINWNFINPRFGLELLINDQQTAYFTFAGAGREPIDNQIFDADNPYDVPKLKTYSLEEVKSEYMLNFELGHQFRTHTYRNRLNAYVLFFTDEIVETSYSYEYDHYMYQNAPTSTHYGIEWEFDWKTPLKNFELSGGMGMGFAKLGDFEMKVYEQSGDEATYDVSGNRIARFPSLVGNIRGTYTYNQFVTSVHIQHIGKQYMDLRNLEHYTLDPYSTLGITLIYNWLKIKNIGEVSFSVRGMNVLNELYAPHGIVDISWEEGYYIPAAERRWLFGINIRL